MPITPRTLFREVGLEVTGAVAWGTPVSSEACGVYVVSLSQDPSRSGGLRAQAPIDRGSIERWIARVPTIELDKFKTTAGGVIERLSRFWLTDESILYIGKATPLRSRINAYYATPLGNRGPHAGGHWIKTLSVLNETFVHFAEVPECEKVEGGIGDAASIYGPGIASNSTAHRRSAVAVRELGDGRWKEEAAQAPWHRKM